MDHNAGRGQARNTQLLYVPAHAPFDLWDRNARHGVKALCSSACSSWTTPNSLHADLPALRARRGRLPTCRSTSRARSCRKEGHRRDPRRLHQKVRAFARRGLATNEDEAAGKEKYASFWKEFGKVLKISVGRITPTRKKIAGLLRFALDPGRYRRRVVSLADHIGA